MKILAFNASPRKNQGTTDIILDHFLEAAEQAEAETKKHYIIDLDVKGCLGCFTCWTKTPGQCVHHDDMDWIIPEYGESDIIVLATPIYNGTTTHYLQLLMERFLPTALPWQVPDSETTRHPSRYQIKPKKMVLIATAGFPDHQAFNIVKQLYPNSLHITLPSAQILQDTQGAEAMKPFTDAVKKAAQQLARQEPVDPETLSKLNVEFSPEMKAFIREQANKYFEAQQGK
jgi:multimeric flavodoxin WrbA